MLSKNPLDIHVQHPVNAPASLPSYSQGIMRRFMWAGAIGVNVELWLQNWFQHVFDHHLRDAIHDRGWFCRIKAKLAKISAFIVWSHHVFNSKNLPTSPLSD
ncbi:hypothetical protein Xvie_03872 [Xenorhabdus vietnamensis]|uniref:Uncharacterized protein n=1 Tax=Xenorhabdus vietnamensis TaxID=351656 RepID=A0A1Y2S8L1_9GAMM|nr:hypothetical protein Xvie_03872 [Xenorhabdus vietnamensis]UVN17730.1 hypothetical protein pXVIEV2_035 [Xenorhabdus vietnamensis]